MNKNRLEAFSDGVIAIIITIMVLEFKVPHDASWASLKELIPVFLSYIISFLLVGIYWGNHHHLLHTVKRVTSGMLLANLHLLFWLSLVPFATGWMGENHFAPNTIIVYGLINILCGVAYSILQKTILNSLDHRSELVTAIEKQYKKAYLSVLAVVIAIPLAFVNPYISGVLFAVQSLVWLIPDKNIEKALKNKTD